MLLVFPLILLLNERWKAIMGTLAIMIVKATKLTCERIPAMMY